MRSSPSWSSLIAGLRDRRGSTVFFVVILMAILAMVPVGMQLMEISHRETKQQLKISAQATNIAAAGLIDAVSWFRRQNTQPVRSFSDPVAYPYADAAFYPRQSSNDTIDESVGLVKEYELTSGTDLWARYEVRRQADPALNAVDEDAVHDVTDKRVQGFQAGEGLCWSIGSIGYVYRLRDPNVAFNASPNVVVARSRVSTEIRRLSITLPVNAAVIKTSRNNTTLTNNGRITGVAAVGLAHYQGNSGPTVSGAGSQYTGSPARSDIDGAGVNGTISAATIFGLTPAELQLMADISVNSIASMQTSYPSMGLVYVNGNATFDATRQLRGGGLLYVNGNLTIQSTSNTLFSGVIFVTGNVTMYGPALVSGCLVVQGNLTLDGSGDVSEAQYDSGILDSVRQQVGQYRENKAAYRASGGL
jgi:hypothetical protein